MTRDEAVALGSTGAADIAEMLDWFDANEPSNDWLQIRHRLHGVAQKAEDAAGVPYGTFGAAGGGPKSPPPPPPGP